MEILLIGTRFRDGGVEQNVNRLTSAFLDKGLSCCYLLGEEPSKVGLQRIPDGVSLKVTSAARRDFFKEFKNQVIEDPPDAVIVFRSTDYARSIKAVSGRVPVILLSGAFTSEFLARKSIRSLRLAFRVWRWWAKADAVLAISPDIKKDWCALKGFPSEKVHEVHPPVVGPDLESASKVATGSQWVDDGVYSIVLGVGRLVKGKRFDLLIQAFGRLDNRNDVRLVILGEGPDEGRLKAIAEDEGLTDKVLFAGYTVNPYSWMSRSRVLVLPSERETFGFVLIEALYLGTPWISVPEPKGPKTVLSETGKGRISEEATSESLAVAIEGELKSDRASDKNKKSVLAYEAASSADEHLKVIRDIIAKRANP